MRKKIDLNQKKVKVLQEVPICYVYNTFTFTFVFVLQEVPIVLVGNKVDLGSEARQVDAVRYD